VSDYRPTTSPLTKRETEILRMFADGMYGPEIAEKLFLSPHTITSYRRKISQKMNTNSIVQSVAEALRQGYIR
jgi:DNA-binding CsgD family transcriptional regulator